MAERNMQVVTEFQPSMTEWLASLGEEKESAEFRLEDNTKDTRLEILHQTIGLKYERPVEFPAVALRDRAPEFLEFLDKHGDELCALRLVSSDPTLPKLRNRGLTIREVFETWFQEQDIDASLYTASFRPHAETYPWSMIIVIREEGIMGEMIKGQHAQLTHGSTKSSMTRFLSHFDTWEWENEVEGAMDALEQALSQLRVPESARQIELAQKLGAHFTHGYLTGYFEAILWTDDVVRFSDYNRILHTRIPVPKTLQSSGEGIRGSVAYAGCMQGRVRIIDPEVISTSVFSEGDILVTDNTDIRFVPLMYKAGAIVTDRGGMLSHASIVARELKKPCIVGTKNATELLRSGDFVEVDADKGVVRILERAMR